MASVESLACELYIIQDVSKYLSKVAFKFKFTSAVERTKYVDN